jgi:hypothetical protein
MSAKENAVNNHKTSFQVNSPQNFTYSFVYEKFLELNKDANIIFVAMNDKADNGEYIWGFKKFLTLKEKPFERISFQSMDNVSTVLKKGVKNVIIPSSGSKSAFETLIGELNLLNLHDTYDLTLFGYPDWQILADANEDALDKYKCTYYTTFLSNPTSKRHIAFNSKFKHWFKKGQLSTCPKFGELGYDIGAFFISGLNDYGAAFADRVGDLNYSSLQNPFSFVRKNNWSGFENNVVMFVFYKGNDVIEIKRYE